MASQTLALEAAVARATAGERVVVVSAASAYHLGGGFRTGGRHALEESMCTQTSLAVSLQQALWLSQRRANPVKPPPHVDPGEWPCYIPDDGVVFSPMVEVFRGGYNTGYRFLPTPVELAAVVSVAMPNRNPSVRDAPMDAPASLADYRTMLRVKFRAVLGAARLAGANVVVLPAVGCGVYRNDPVEMGRALGEALCTLPACISAADLHEVVLAGAPPDMLKAAQQEIGW
eukprot:CAMPEP_0171131260 /NCGR_PEP_ID=MMETSP0766_2-20121228/122402_1 /TAXON_ID=439317 /ORGANISM="Gambierdiscus australes, Strain CAWD 149" /LENGTH=229 /DNA_ID=CAMNT_0011594547 /DNA_START=20 /DNA_END=709 /DNA_ORIENTATION=-